MKCEREKLLVWLLASLLLWCFVLPAATYGDDIKAAPIFNTDTMPLPSPGLTSETQPMPNWDNFDEILTTLEAESAKLSAELATISAELTKREQQANELESALQASAARIATLERTMNMERSGSEAALSLGLEREATAIKERDFWRIGGISCAAVGIIALALSFIF